MAPVCKIAIVTFIVTVTPDLAFGLSDLLGLSSSLVPPGGTASLNLSLRAGSGGGPAGLQWTITYPPSVIADISASPGPAAIAAGKTLSCTAASGTYMCLLTGLSTSGLNINVIQNGVVAVVTATISPGAPTAAIAVTNALGATPPGIAVPILALGGTIVTSTSRSFSTLTCSPTTVHSGASATCSVTPNEAAPAGGAIVGLSSNNALLTVPASVAVGAGATSATFVAAAGTVTATQLATVTATLGGTSHSITLSLTDALLISALTCSATTLDAGASSICTVTLSAPAPSGGVSVPVSTSSSTLGVPASVNVAAGSSEATFRATATTVPPGGDSTQSVLVTASLNGASQSEPFTLIICPCSLWPSTAQPVDPSSTGTEAIEVGVKFTSTVSAHATGVRFFKATENGGMHLGNLWTSEGTHLAQVTFTNETSSGWQVAYFPSPIAIAANTTYVISYHAPQGHTAADNGAFVTPLSNLPLQALAGSQDQPNGLYKYGSSAFPTTASSATNYWVDVILNTSTAIGTAAPVSLWPSTAVPDTRGVSSAQSGELGLTFVSEISGYVTGVRFYKSSENLGQHVGYLWTEVGTLLASVTFTSETASGWQQANFASPVAIAANTPYVISYWAPEGHNADDALYFATAGVGNQMLYAPPNGAYGPNSSYADSKVFPTSSSDSGNYWVDLVFTTAVQ